MVPSAAVEILVQEQGLRSVVVEEGEEEEEEEEDPLAAGTEWGWRQSVKALALGVRGHVGWNRCCH